MIDRRRIAGFAGAILVVSIGTLLVDPGMMPASFLTHETGSCLPWDPIQQKFSVFGVVKAPVLPAATERPCLAPLNLGVR